MNMKKPIENMHIQGGKKCIFQEAKIYLIK